MLKLLKITYTNTYKHDQAVLIQIINFIEINSCVKMDMDIVWFYHNTPQRILPVNLFFGVERRNIIQTLFQSL